MYPLFCTTGKEALSNSSGDVPVPGCFGNVYYNGSHTKSQAPSLNTFYGKKDNAVADKVRDLIMLIAKHNLFFFDVDA